MKIHLHIDHLQELSEFIAGIDRHRAGALILLAALIGVPALALAAYVVLR